MRERGRGEGEGGGRRREGKGRERTIMIIKVRPTVTTHILPTFSVSRSKSLATCSAHCISFFDSGG